MFKLNMFRLNMFKLNMFKLNMFKLNMFKLNMFRLNMFRLNMFKLNMFRLNMFKLNMFRFMGVDLNFLVGVQGSSYYPNLTGIFFVVSAFNQLISIIRKNGGAYAIWGPLNPLTFRPCILRNTQ